MNKKKGLRKEPFFPCPLAVKPVEKTSALPAVFMKERIEKPKPPNF